MAEGHHYGPGPWVDKAGRADWTSVYYHRADERGLGFDRTATGSNAIAQYAPELAEALGQPRHLPREPAAVVPPRAVGPQDEVRPHAVGRTGAALPAGRGRGARDAARLGLTEGPRRRRALHRTCSSGSRGRNSTRASGATRACCTSSNSRSGPLPAGVEPPVHPRSTSTRPRSCATCRDTGEAAVDAQSPLRPARRRPNRDRCDARDHRPRRGAAQDDCRDVPPAAGPLIGKATQASRRWSTGASEASRGRLAAASTSRSAC